MLGKKIEYQQVDFDTYWALAGSSSKYLPAGHTGASAHSESEAAPARQGDSFIAQHLRHVTTVGHQNGLFSGTNDFVEKIGGKPPTTLEQFIRDNREVFV